MASQQLFFDEQNIASKRYVIPLDARRRIIKINFDVYLVKYEYKTSTCENRPQNF